MARNPVFDWVCDELESFTSLNQLEARGTVRIALKSAGLDAGSVTSEQMAVTLEQVLPGELDRRNVQDASARCQDLASRLLRQRFEEQAQESPEAVFQRLVRKG